MTRRIRMICLTAAICLALAAAGMISWRWVHSALSAAPEETAAQTETAAAEATQPAQTVPVTTEPPAVETTAATETTAAVTIPEETISPQTQPPKTTIEAVPRYYQTDYPDIRYGTGTVASCGSNVTALAMVATYLTNHVYQPDEIADWMVQITGSSYKRLEQVSDLLQLPWYRAGNIDIALNAVKEGKTAIFMMNERSLFGSGHFIVVTGVNEAGRYLVLDPDPANDTAWNLAEGFETGFTRDKLIAGFAGAWVYDKSQMPEEPFVYVPEAPPAESRYPGLELTEAEVNLMADLICMEGESEPFEGQQAIAEVILNRLVSGKFQSSINSIIYAKDQFAAAKNLYLAKPTDTQYKAVERALNGPYVLPIDVVFYAKFKVNNNFWGQIGDHYFCYGYDSTAGQE